MDESDGGIYRRQRTFIYSVYAALYEGKLNALAIGHSALNDRTSLKLLQVCNGFMAVCSDVTVLQADSPSPYQWLVPLLVAPFIAIRPEVDPTPFHGDSAVLTAWTH